MTNPSERLPEKVSQERQLAENPKHQEPDISSILEVEAPEVLASLSKDKRKRLLAVMRSVTLTKTHSGPIPRPEDVAEYNRHIPDGANRIMQMAEEQAKHRMEMERIIVTNQQAQSGRGQVFGLIIGLFGIGAGGTVAVLGHDVVGAAIAGTTVVSLVYAFITGRRRQQQPSDKS